MAAKPDDTSANLIQFSDDSSDDLRPSPTTSAQVNGTPTSQRETVDPSSTPASGSTTGQSNADSNMEIAYEELKATVDEATSYKDAGNFHTLHLQRLIQLLLEDMQPFAETEIADDDLRTRSAQLLRTARNLRRGLEKEIINIRIEQQQSEPQQATTEVIAGVFKPTSLKLAPLQLPVFEGDATQFRVFRTFFEDNILKNESLTDTAKWLRLTQCLKGRPLELLSEIPQDAESLQTAWDLLVKIYGKASKPVVDLYSKLQSLQPATSRTDDLRLVHTKLEGILMTLQRLGQEVETNLLARWLYIAKFPSDVMYFAKKSDETPLSEIRIAMDQLITNREGTDQHRLQFGAIAAPELPKQLPAPSIQTVAEAQPQQPKPPQPARRPAATGRGLRCVFCEEDHWNDACTKYPTVETRKRRLTGKCFRCLRAQHTTSACKVDRRCFFCDSMEHNRALCPKKFGEEPKPAAQMAILADSAAAQGTFLTFLVYAKSSNHPQPIQLRAVLDTAGGATIVNERVATALNLTKSNKAQQYIGLNGALLSKGYDLHETIQLMALDGSEVQIQAALIDGEIPNVPAPDIEQFRKTYPHCNEVYIPPTGEGQPVDLLIGSDLIAMILKPQQINAINAELLLLPTKFGSLLVGKQRQHQHQVCHTINFSFLSNPVQSISDLDVVGLTGLVQSDIDDEEQAIQNFYKTVTFENNRYSISWPWRTHPPLLDSNFGLALGRLRSLYKRLQKTPQILQDYHDIIQTQLRIGIVEEVRNINSNSNVVHYLPHHPVIQPEKSTSLRPVYDGSSKPSPRSKSLNENIHKGSKWLNDLVTTLVRFRKHRYVVVADIARAFHQIGINESDRDAARFLWLRDPSLPPTDDNLVVLRFTRVAFGIIASPFLLHAVIRHHANQQESHPFIDIILQDLYADNLVTTFSDESQLKIFYDFAKQFFSSMSMNLTKWATNSSSLEQAIPEEDQQPEPVQSILGLKWNKQTDTIAIKKPAFKFQEKPTPRTVARDMAIRFDPLGWMAPVTLLPKLFFRLVWDEYKAWDTQLSQQHTEQWYDIARKLTAIEGYTLPRRMSTFEEPFQKEIHTFVDASASAYAIVTYLKTTKNGETQISIIAAKTRLAPKKTVTIPKLELIAILLGCRFTKYIKTALQYQEEVPTFIWSDSKCALSWMQQRKILPAIMEKYIAEAKQYGITHFNYVPSSQNYADVATRGADLQTLESMNWWSAPQWLQADSYPQTIQFTEEDSTKLLIFQTTVTLKQKIASEAEKTGLATLDIAKFRSLHSLLMRTLYCFQAVNRLLKKNVLHIQNAIDTSLPLIRWLKWDQDRCYALQDEPEAGKKFLLRNISVFRDADGLIRCQTRITNSVAALDTVNPVLLVKKSTLTRLIILHYHYKTLHTGTSHTLAALRKKYWLPQGRREVYTVIVNHCFQCRRQTAVEYPMPPSAPLPEFRVSANHRPFQAVGIDVCGPFYTRTVLEAKQPKQERYVLLFTCAAVRAIHLEVLQEMLTEEILLAFRRFFARRGVPAKIISDNAPQFHVLDGCFKDLWKDLAQSKSIVQYFAQEQISWEFTPEISPWMGGMYERLIQSVKKAFERTYGSKILLDRQFETSIIEIEAIINSRPLTYVDRDADSPILTPNDFLMARYNAFPMNDKIQRDDDHLKKLWRSTQSYLNEYWKNWSDHYLLLLRERNDHFQNSPRTSNTAPQKGDVVVMIDMAKKRSSWITAVVERRCVGTDGQIRAVQIRTSDGRRYIRPITQLAPLKLTADLPNVNDDQLTKNREAIVVYEFPEGATQYIEIDEEQQELPYFRRHAARNEEEEFSS